MLKKILSTFSTNVATAGLNFLLFMLTAKLLGAQGRGEISLFVTNIALVILFCNLVGGAALIYLSSRYNTFQLALPSYVFAIVTAIATSFSLIWAGQTLPVFENHLIATSVLSGLTSVNMMLMLGKEKVLKYNIVTVLQGAILFTGFASMALLYTDLKVEYYIWATYAAFISSLLLSTLWIWPDLKKIQWTGFTATLQILVKTSATAQFSNIISFLNYRLSYYFLNHFEDTKAIGIFSTGMALSEAVWLVSRSIALVQYSRISNTEDGEYAKQLSFNLVKLSFWASVACILPLALMPSSFFTLLFGPEFGMVKMVILSLCTGIIAISTSTIFSHYFSGTGKYYINNYASLTGLLITIPAGLLLIPVYGMLGAGFAASLSYLAVATFLYITFRRHTGFHINKILLTRADLAMLKRVLTKKDLVG
jgi:O-antigen/teichoic acid export membrane protein